MRSLAYWPGETWPAHGEHELCYEHLLNWANLAGEVIHVALYFKTLVFDMVLLHECESVVLPVRTGMIEVRKILQV